MNEGVVKLIGLLLLIVIGLPLTYIYYFLIWQLPKKYCFTTRWAIVFGYIFIFFIDTYLLSEGLIGLLIFFLVPLLIQLGGAYYFRAELKEDIQRMCWKLKHE